MTKVKLIIFAISVLVVLHGCSKILEPVVLKANTNQSVLNEQESFDINIDTLTFEKAKIANTFPYKRQLMIKGSGKRANVFNEVDFLINTIPNQLINDDYILGIGDELKFVVMPEFKSELVKWPKEINKKNYLLGIGDELTFVQKTSRENIKVITDPLKSELLGPQKDTGNIVSIRGVIGSNGNILLLGVGSLKAAKRNLDEIRAEVRNILIRNDSETNFQLEITKFKSQKAFVTIRLDEEVVISDDRTISLNNTPLSLQEVALASGLSRMNKNHALITLSRDKEVYRFTAKQLFADSSPEIFIQDKDQIEINLYLNSPNRTDITIGSKGNIFIPNLGKIKAVNLTLANLQGKVKKLLVNKGLIPNFQLDLKSPKNKKIYLVEKNVGSAVTTLSDHKVTLKEFILKSKSFALPGDGLSLVTLTRDKKVYRLTSEKILDPGTPDIILQGNDQIEIESLSYKKGKVFVLGGTGLASIIPIDPSKRETLADVLFVSDGAFKNRTAQRSEVYLLRGKNPSVAYHLDTQNVSRILVAAKTELRPNDIIYVADRPIISFVRTLSELAPLRILLRDIKNENIP